MSDTTDLLKQLRVERDAEIPATNTASTRPLYALALVLVLALAAAGFQQVGKSAPDAVVEVISPEPVPAATTSAETLPNAVLNASGYVVARRQATIAAKITARVAEVYIDEGQSVAANEVIAVMDDTNIRAALVRETAQLQQARASLNAAQVALHSDEPLFARSRLQLERGIGTQQDFDAAQARHDGAAAAVDVATQAVAVAEANRDIAQRNLDDTIVRAPFAGVVTVKAAQPGEMVSPVSAGGGFTRTGIGTIVDMASLGIDVDVSESFINRITASQPVTVRLNAYPDWEIAGRVITVVPTADRAKATVKVRIGLNELDSRILPDMGARVTFLNPTTEIQQ